MYPVNFSPLPARGRFPAAPCPGAPDVPWGLGRTRAAQRATGHRARLLSALTCPVPPLAPGHSGQAAGGCCPTAGTAELPALRRLPQPPWGNRSPDPTDLCRSSSSNTSPRAILHRSGRDSRACPLSCCLRAAHGKEPPARLGKTTNHNLY